MKKILVSLLIFLVAGFFLKTTLSSKEVDGGKKNNEVENKNTVDDKDNQQEDIKYPNDDVNIQQTETEYPFKTNWIVKDEIKTLDSSFNQIKTTISSESIVIYQDGIKWNKDNTYKISANISSKDKIVLNINIKNNDEVLSNFNKEISGSEEISFEFMSLINNDWTGKVEIEISSDSNDNQIVIENFKIVNDNVNEYSIRLNQLGYLVNEKKVVVFPYTQGDFFEVVDYNTNEVVYTAPIANPVWSDQSKERNSVGDFTNFRKEGKYYIRSQILGKSHPFEIGNTIYNNVLKDALKMISLQRCGAALDASWAGKFHRESCHLDHAILYEDQQYKLDVAGGWHDAGDYGRYIETGSKSVFDLLFAYMINPSAFDDNLNILESKNEIPDILDEIRYELEWMLKLQTEWGGVYNKVTTQHFAEDILPEDDIAPLYVLEVETAPTGDFIAAMALASKIYEEFDQEFSEKLLSAAKLSWDYLSSRDKSIEYKNPAHFNTGNYRDEQDSDEKFFASIALWDVTQDDKYLDYAKALFNNDNKSGSGTSWINVGGFGSYIYLTNDKADSDSEFYKNLKKNLEKDAAAIASLIETNTYSVGLDYFSWGSNGKVLNQAITLLMVSEINQNIYYRSLALDQVNYIFGNNSLNKSFVVGYGGESPKNPHHRISKINNAELTGALVGGVNADRDDPIISKLPESTALSKMYVDSYDSYASNEVTIYWNSSLVFVLSYFN
ncbi:MAG: glycoside hydrolase family 9 protein [Anaerorhabdus sp.]